MLQKHSCCRWRLLFWRPFTAHTALPAAFSRALALPGGGIKLLVFPNTEITCGEIWIFNPFSRGLICFQVVVWTTEIFQKDLNADTDMWQWPLAASHDCHRGKLDLAQELFLASSSDLSLMFYCVLPAVFVFALKKPKPWGKYLKENNKWQPLLFFPILSLSCSFIYSPKLFTKEKPNIVIIKLNWRSCGDCGQISVNNSQL